MAVCHYCPAPATTLDHVIARSLGGPRTQWNLVPACVACNTAKGPGTYESFTGSACLPQRCREHGYTTTADFLARYGHLAPDERRAAARHEPEPRKSGRKKRKSAVVADDVSDGPSSRWDGGWRHPAWVCAVPDEG